MFDLDEQYLNLIHVSKIIANETKKKITYYFDGGRIKTETFADSSDYEEKLSSISSFMTIGNVMYNVQRIGIAKQTGANVRYEFLGGKVLDYAYDSTDEADSAIETISATHIEVDGKWYNGYQLHIADADENALTIKYEFLGRNIFEVVYDDQTAFEEAKEKLTSISESGSGGGSSSGTRTATPTFSVASGAVEDGTTTTISCSTSGATIHYTTDGTEPTLDSDTYSDGTELTINPPATFKACAVLLGLATSKTATASYTLKPEELYYYAGIYPNPDESTDVIPTFDKTMLNDLVDLKKGLAEQKEMGGVGDEWLFTDDSTAGQEYGARIVYAYPASLGELTKYVTNGIQGDITDSFTLQTATISGVEYNIWVLTDSAMIDGIPYGLF